MPTITPFSSKKVLIIDDIAEVRSQLQMTLTSIGFEKLHTAPTIKDAMDRIFSTQYDVILCDYNLGKGTNGQQFLEHMRTTDKLSRGSIFIMVTAENTYEKVVAAAEYMPDDYLLKPFTAAHLISRLNLLIERQLALYKINHAYDQKNWKLTVEECDLVLSEKNKFYIEVSKIKAAALMRSDLFDEAVLVFEEILNLRDLPWAVLGLARAKAKLGFVEESQEILNKLIDENPQFLASFDFSSELLMQQNKHEEAMEVLQKAMGVNSENLSRARSYTVMALAKGDFESAERIIRDNIKRHRYSPLRDSSDYGMLSRALVEQGKVDEAITVLDEAKKQFKDDASTAILAASSSIAWLRAGESEKAASELRKALSTDYLKLPPSVATTLAEACYSSGKDEEANNLLRQVLQNNPDDLKLQSKVKMVQVMAGKTMEESNALIQDSAKEVIRINNEGVRKAKEGKYEEAVELVIGAAERLPQNLNIVSNAALIIAVALTKTAFNQELLEKCLKYRERVFSLNPNHPKISQIDSMLEKIKESV